MICCDGEGRLNEKSVILQSRWIAIKSLYLHVYLLCLLRLMYYCQYVGLLMFNMERLLFRKEKTSLFNLTIIFINVRNVMIRFVAFAFHYFILAHSSGDWLVLGLDYIYVWHYISYICYILSLQFYQSYMDLFSNTMTVLRTLEGNVFDSTYNG